MKRITDEQLAAEHHKEMEIFGSILKALRTLKAMSQKDLSQNTGLSRETISKIEHGSMNPSLTTILALARGLGVDPINLLRDIEKQEELPYYIKMFAQEL